MKSERIVGRLLGLMVLSIFSFLFSFALAQELLNYPLDTINGEEVYRYEVERGVGLYRIGVNFNVTQDEIIRLNPQLRERGLHYGETIYLPTGRPVIKETPAVVIQTSVKQMREDVPKPVREPEIVSVQEPVKQPDSIDNPKEIDFAQIIAAVQAAKDSTLTDSIGNDTTLVLDSLAILDTLALDTRPVTELALMLPFESRQSKRSGNAERMMEFYQGALLALHELQHDSVRYRLRVYDTERSERRINELCDSTELDSVQGVLGLVYPIQIDRMSAWCDSHDVPLLLPFSDDMDLPTNQHLLQFNSTDQQEADSLCQWIAKHDVRCVAVEVREADLTMPIRTLRKEMRRRGLTYTGLPFRDLLNDSAYYAFRKDQENLVILHSDRLQQVRMLLPHLMKLQQEGYPIRLVSQYSWQKESIDLPQVYTSVFTSDADRDAYDRLWHTFFGSTHVSEAPRYDLLGYDLMRALIAWLNGEKEHHGLQSDIRWRQVEDGGHQNAQVRVIER